MGGRDYRHDGRFKRPQPRTLLEEDFVVTGTANPKPHEWERVIRTLLVIDLETIREYGLDRLADSAEEFEVRSRHASFFAMLA